MSLTAVTAVVGAAAVAAVFFVCFRKGVLGVSRRAIAAGLMAKLIAGLLLYLVYTQHYTHRGTSDSFRYFDDAMVLNSYLGERNDVWLRFFFGGNTTTDDLNDVNARLRAWQTTTRYGIANDNPTIIRINMVIGLFSGGLYLLHVFWMCVLALFGHLFLARGLTDLIDRGANATPVFVGSLVFPTVLFWGSGVLKEVPLLVGLGLFFFALSGGWRSDRRRWLALLPALMLLAFSKPYVWITLAAPLIAFGIVRITRWKPVWVFPTVLVLAYAAAVNADAVYPPGDFLYILSKKQTDFYNVAEMNAAGSAVEVSPVAQTAVGFLADAPERLALTYMRPWPWEAGGALQWAAVLENLLFLFLLGWMVTVWVRSRKHHPSALNALLWLVFSFALVFGLVAGSTVPVLGAMVRYKLPVLLLLGAATGFAWNVKPTSTHNLKRR